MFRISSMNLNLHVNLQSVCKACNTNFIHLKLLLIFCTLISNGMWTIMMVSRRGYDMEVKDRGH